MNTILTDDERRAAIRAALDASDGGNAFHNLCRKIESAVLAKLWEQEPMAYGMPDTQLGRKHRLMMVRLDKGQNGCTLPLCAAPLPAVVQVPQGWIGKMDFETLKARGRVTATLYGEPVGDKSNEVGLYAAAPEAPAQGSYKPCPQCGANTASPNPANWCACPKVAAPEAPAQGDAHKDRMQKVREFIQADADLARGVASTEAPAQPSVPAPWREAVKVAQKPIGWVLVNKDGELVGWHNTVHTFDPSEGGFSDHPKIADANDPDGEPHRWVQVAALAQLDALEGGE